MVTPADRLRRIVEEAMCIGCGLCEAVAGPDLVRMAESASGYAIPIANSGLDDATVDRIYRTCPGTRLEGLPERLAEGGETDLIWGPWRRMVLGWAAEPEVRHLGSTGGMLTALALHLVTEAFGRGGIFLEAALLLVKGR